MPEEQDLGIWKRQISSLDELRQRQEKARAGVESYLQGQTPWWSKAASTVTAPFRWIGENVTEPFGAAVTAPWTPTLEQAEEERVIANLPWFQRQLADWFPAYGKELAEYEAWEAPGFELPVLGRLDVKTAVETIPWLAVPSGAGIIAKVGGLGAKAVGSLLGRGVGKAALRGVAAAAKGVGAVERAAAYPIAKPLELATKKILSGTVGSEIARIHNASQGATFNLEKGNLLGKPLYAVGNFPDRTVTIKGAQLTDKQINGFLKANEDLLAKPDLSFGSWVNREGDSVLDVVRTLPNRKAALHEASTLGEEAIFGLGGEGEINVASTLVRDTTTDALKKAGVFDPDDVINIANKTIQSPELKRRIRNLTETIVDYTAMSTGEATSRQGQEIIQRLIPYLREHTVGLRAAAANPQNKLAAKSAELLRRLEPIENDLFSQNPGAARIAVDTLMSLNHRVEPSLLPQVFGIPKATAENVGLGVTRLPKIIEEINSGKIGVELGGYEVPRPAIEKWLIDVGEGQPGLTWAGRSVVYRSPEGMPVGEVALHARADGKIQVDRIVIDGESGHKIEATKAFLQAAREMPDLVAPPAAEMSAQARKVWNSYQKILSGRNFERIKKAFPPDTKASVNPPPPPVKPPKLTTAAAPEPKPPKKTAADKRAERFWESISGKAAEDAWNQTAKMRSEIMAERAAQIKPRLDQLAAEGKLTHEAIQQVWNELGSGELPRVTTRMTFAKTFEKEGLKKIHEVVGHLPYEEKATIDAFRNALAGKPVPRVPGRKGGSAYSRLEHVFGTEAAETLADPKKLDRLVEDMIAPQGVDPELLQYIQGLSNVPYGQSNMFPQFFTKEGAQYQLLDPLDPDVLKLSSQEILERFGMGATQDARTTAQKQLDYWAMLRAQGKLPNTATDFPVFPDDKAIRQLSMLPQGQREKISNFMKKSGMTMLDLANLPRSFLASFDVSGLLRQGIILFASHPIEGLKTIRPMFQALISKDSEKAVEAIIKSRPHTAHADMYGLFRGPITTAKRTLTEGEEAFASTFTNMIPGVSASARAYITVLNDLRSRVWEKTLSSWERAGLKVTPDDYKDLARVINWASGRGSYPTKSLERAGGLMSALLFSPRLLLSRIEFPLAMFPGVTKSALARREAQKMMLSFMGAGSTLLGLIQLGGGGKIELDPRSADFGKMVIGDTRLDIWSGYAQLSRFTAQMFTAERKSTGTGLTQDINRIDVASRFLQSKLSPAAGLIHDLLKGETYLGEELPPKSAKSALGQIYERMAPLAIQDLIAAYDQGGLSEAYAASTGILGVGVVTYTDDLKKARDEAAQDKYNMSWDDVGRQYGRATQLQLEQTSTKVQDAIKEYENRFASGKPSTMQQWRDEGQVIEDTYRRAVELAAQEFRVTNDGLTFREKVDRANDTKRDMYETRARKDAYKSIVDYYSQPLTQAQINEMNPGDVLRNQFYKEMYGADMYDQYHNYNFELAKIKRDDFVRKYGQSALDYIDEYQQSRWVDAPAELRYLEDSKKLMQPYWQIEDYIWSLYPPQMKQLADQIEIMERTDPDRARAVLKSYPQILRARELIARYKKTMRDSNPMLLSVYRLFYGG